MLTVAPENQSNQKDQTCWKNIFQVLRSCLFLKMKDLDPKPTDGDPSILHTFTFLIFNVLRHIEIYFFGVFLISLAIPIENMMLKSIIRWY